MQSPGLDDVIYIIAASFQLVAMVFAVKMIRETKDRRPWLVLFTALVLQFSLRCLRLLILGHVFSAEVLSRVSPPAALAVSILLFTAMFFIRTIAVAERDSENRYRSLVELSPDVIFVNSGNRIVYINAAAVRFFGASSASQLLGRSPLDFTATTSAEVVRERIAALSNGAATVPGVEEDWIRLDGSIVTVEAVAASIPWQGGKAIQVVLRDITDRKRAEREKSNLLASERVARSNAEHANRMKDQFLATLSHELRTPLNAILGWSQLLRTGLSDKEELTQGLDTIERNARAQTQLIEDLLDMSRIISGKLRLDIQPVAPLTFITSAIETVRPAAEAKSIRIEQMLDPLAGPVSGDANRLQQIAWNLLSNAVKFTPRGGKVQVVLQRVNSHIEITVTDTGQGISQEFLPFLFERFRQADASTTRRHGGLGLGLSIAKQLVDLHGGTIEAESSGEGQGSTFVLRLPLVAIHPSVGEQDDDAPFAPPPVESAGKPDLSNIRVLVVDDEADSRDLIKRVLQSCRAQVMTAASAVEAMSMLGGADVLLSDIGMPEIDGFEFLRRVRTHVSPEIRKLPAIALTAFARSEDRTRALLAGYQVHLSKPVSSAELIATVASVSGRTTAAAANYTI
jgi:PAS domain S-box-containing protein